MSAPTPSPEAPREAARRTAFVVLALIVIGLVAWQLAQVFLLLFGGILAATALRVPARLLERRLHLEQGAAVAIAVLLVIAVAGLVGWQIGDRMAAQFENLREGLPRALDALTAWLNRHAIGLALLQLWRDVKGADVPWARVASAATLSVHAVFNVFLVLVIGIYLAADPDLYRRGVVGLVPRHWRAPIDQALRDSGHALTRWLMGQLVSMSFVGAATAIGLALLGMPLALSLGVIAATLGFIPFFGAITSGVLMVLLAFVQGPTEALYVAALALAIQQAENHLLVPLIQRWSVSLPPVLSILAAVIFGVLFGIAGVLLAAPLMVVSVALVRRLYVEEVLEASPVISPSGR
ncbi:MAG TPA: AI-2E family transporter [Burkholderiaceae bacterium]|jgi:predicted PurR-regulated permease PerM